MSNLENHVISHKKLNTYFVIFKRFGGKKTYHFLPRFVWFVAQNHGFFDTINFLHRSLNLTQVDSVT